MTDESAWSERTGESAARVDLGPLKAAHGVGDMTDQLTLDELRVALLEYMQAFLSGDTDAHIKVHEFEQAVRRDERAPCQHYWLQYMRLMSGFDLHDATGGARTSGRIACRYLTSHRGSGSAERDGHYSPYRPSPGHPSCRESRSARIRAIWVSH